MTDPVDGQMPADNTPGVDHGYWSERRRFVKAFVDRTGAARRGERLRMGPLAVAGVIAVTLVAGLAVGAVPRLLGSSGTSSTPGATGKPVAALAGIASSTPGSTPSQRETHAAATRRRSSVPASTVDPPAAAVPAATPATGTTPAAPTTPAARATPARTPSASPSPQANAVNYQAVTGYGCPQPQDATSDVYGWYTQGTTGFFTVSSGSTTQSGCSGAFVAMPMSGSSTTDDTQNLAIWTFRFPAGEETCRVDIYIPDDTNITEVGGDPSLYTVYDNGAVVGSFYVDQVGQLGSWVTGGTFPISSGVMTVQVHSRGQNWVGSTNTNAHIAVAAASAACQPT